jgi:single-stranded-DNA-specific exonuclease
MNRTWHPRPLDLAAAQALADELGQPLWLASLLTQRGLAHPAAARAFLDPRLADGHSPWLLEGMEKAVDRLLRAQRDRERVAVWGDYDVDGVTSTTLLLELFRFVGIQAVYTIPDRIQEGYGLNAAGLERLRDQGCRVVVSVDCGVSACAEALAARALGLDLIITDHHEPGAELPQALALLNPKTAPRYPYAMLGGVGVAYKLALALLERAGGEPNQDLQDRMLELVALGTVADVAPLDGENRALVREGIRRLRATRFPGLAALAEVAGIDIRRLDAAGIGFGLAPRLNAGGRIGDPKMGVELMLCQPRAKALELARLLDAENQRRRSLEKATLEQARPLAQARVDAGARAILLASADWHPGVVGLAASRLAEAFHRPVGVFSLQQGLAKGSLRCRPPFCLPDALRACERHLLRYGGHAVAAGATMQAGSFEAFRADFEAYASQVLSEADMVPSLKTDLDLDLGQVGAELMKGLSLLSPFGMGNPKPVFVARGARLLAGAKGVGGQGEHLKAVARQGVRNLPCIGFGLGADLARLDLNRPLDLAFQPAWNDFMGRRELQLELKDIRQEA